jgi:hypothetical protein
MQTHCVSDIEESPFQPTVSKKVVIPAKAGIQDPGEKGHPVFKIGSRLSPGLRLDAPVSEYGTGSSGPA